MKYVAALVLVGAYLVAALPLESEFKPNAALDQRWERYKVDFNKAYKDAAEESKRRQIWEANVAIIDKQNADFEQGLTTWLAAENQFTDRTDEEKAASTGLSIPSGLKRPKPPVVEASSPTVGLANPQPPAYNATETKPAAATP